MDWGYTEENGPFAWHKQYPIGGEGRRQSPINIQIVADRYNGNVCCNKNNDTTTIMTTNGNSGKQCISYECLRQRMSQNISLHEQSQNTGNIHKRSHNHHHNHNHHLHHRHHHHNQLLLRHSSNHNENKDFLNSTGNSPVGGSSSASSLTSPSPSSSSSSSPSSSSTSTTTDASSSTSSSSSPIQNQPEGANKGLINYYQSHKKIFLGYPRSLNNLHVTNTGHGWQVDIPTEISHHTLLSGPPLGDREYRLAQFHCHWGEDCNHGSEHLINGKSFAAELHFVHWNSTDFDSLEEAAKHKHGLAVLGVLVQALEGEQNRNKYLDKIIQTMEFVNEPGSSSSIQDHFDIKKLFPTNRWMFASYEGSLTTPPLSEVVDWVVFFNPIQCSTSQIESFRRLKCGDSKRRNLISNCRPIQPVHDRTINVWTHH